MGCWNKTCGLTRLHITMGEPVYVFALEKADAHERCYSTAFWKPCLVPWEAEYNDYGGGENDHGIGIKYVMNGVRKTLVELEVGENPYHDIAVKREGFGLEQFYEAVHEGRLLSKSLMRKETEVDFVMMKKSVVDDLLNTWEIKDCRLDKNNELEYYSYGYDDLLDDIPVYLKEIKQHLDSDDNLTLMRLYSDGRDRNNTETKFIKEHVGDIMHRFSNFVDVRNQVIKLVENDKQDEAAELLKYFLKGSMLNIFFEMARINWAPGGHEGSQSTELDAHETLVDVIKEAIVRERAEAEEY